MAPFDLSILFDLDLINNIYSFIVRIFLVLLVLRTPRCKRQYWYFQAKVTIFIHVIGCFCTMTPFDLTILFDLDLISDKRYLFIHSEHFTGLISATAWYLFCHLPGDVHE